MPTQGALHYANPELMTPFAKQLFSVALPGSVFLSNLSVAREADSRRAVYARRCAALWAAIMSRGSWPRLRSRDVGSPPPEKKIWN